MAGRTQMRSYKFPHFAGPSKTSGTLQQTSGTLLKLPGPLRSCTYGIPIFWGSPWAGSILLIVVVFRACMMVAALTKLLETLLMHCWDIVSEGMMFHRLIEVAAGLLCCATSVQMSGVWSG